MEGSLVYFFGNNYKYYQSNYDSMSNGIKTLNLRFSEKIFSKIKIQKEKSKARSWEDYIKKLVFGENDASND